MPRAAMNPSALTNASLAVLLLAACATPARTPAPAAAHPTDAAAHRVASNILFSDYAGSAACKRCHPATYAEWAASPMRRMTRAAEQADVRAPFDGRVFRFHGDTARLSAVGGARFMELDSRRYGRHAFRLTRVIGGRTREDFVGAEVERAAPDARLLEPGVERVLPVSFVYASGLRLKGYSVMVGPRDALVAGPVWQKTCILCHNTAPYVLSVLGALAGPRPPGYQGEVPDRVLPRHQRWSYKVRDWKPMARALDEEMARLGAPRSRAEGPELVRDAVVAVRDHLGPQHLVELGIGCESCHGGARGHVEDPSVLPSFLPESDLVRIGPQKGRAATRAEAINRACARCHQVLFSRYPFTWEGGLRTRLPGGSNINSGEARDFLLGGCATAMACSDCHDPHTHDRRKEQALETNAGNAVCLRCHDRYKAPEALRAHSHHDPAGAGSACVACHMPKKNMGLAYSLTRYHRIGSPTDPARVYGDRPLECSLCHADRSTRWALEAMQRLWGKRYDAELLRPMYGDLDAPPLLPVLALGKPHEQAVAIALLGERRDRAAVPVLARQLASKYPLLRYWARHALERITGKHVEIDLDAPEAEIAASASRLAGAALSPARSEGGGGDDED